MLARDPEGHDHVATIFDGADIPEGTLYMASNGWEIVTYEIHLTNRDW